MPLNVPFVQPPCELLDVSVKMLGAGVMINTVQTALQYGPDALDTVRGHRTARILAGRVVNGIVLVEQAVQVVEHHVVIGVKLTAGFDRAVNLAVDGVQRSSLYYLGARPAFAFPHSQDGSLADRAASRVLFLPLVLVRFLATEKRLVNLDDALQFVDGVGSRARFTQPSQDKPRRLLGDADLFGELHRTDALARRDQQVHGVDPLVQGNLGAFKDRAGSDGEVKIARVAVIEAGTFTALTHAIRFAVWTRRAVRPEMPFEIQARRFRVGDHFHQCVGADGGLAHVSIVDEYSAFVNCTHVYNSPYLPRRGPPFVPTKMKTIPAAAMTISTECGTGGCHTAIASSTNPTMMSTTTSVAP